MRQARARPRAGEGRRQPAHGQLREDLLRRVVDRTERINLRRDVATICRLTDDRCDLLCIDLPKAERLRAARLSESDAQRAAERAKALGDPTRLTLAVALAQTDELCVCDLAWVAERAENLVSHHLRSLRTAGLVSSRRDGKMVLYSLTAAGRALLAALGDPQRVPA